MKTMPLVPIRPHSMLASSAPTKTSGFHLLTHRYAPLPHLSLHLHDPTHLGNFLSQQLQGSKPVMWRLLIGGSRYQLS